MSFNTRSGRQAGRGIQQANFPRQPQSPFQAQYQSAYATPLSQPGPPGAGASPQPLVQQQLQQSQPIQQQLPVQQQQPHQLQQQSPPVTPQDKSFEWPLYYALGLTQFTSPLSSVNGSDCPLTESLKSWIMANPTTILFFKGPRLGQRITGCLWQEGAEEWGTSGSGLELVYDWWWLGFRPLVPLSVGQFKMQQPAPASPVKPMTPQVQPQQTQPLIEGGESSFKGEGRDLEEASKPWKKHKNPSFKVNKVLKRRRQNARFRKLLIPKNAIMVLNELQPGVTFEADEQTNAFSQVCYTVRLKIDGDTYTGEGTSKAGAKAAAAESAVKGLILKKIAEAGIKKPESIVEDESMDAAGSGDESSINGKRTIPEDEVPWGSLASFALFKLFADWKSQGTAIPPVMAPPPIKPIPKVTGVKTPPLTKGTIPENPELLHPVTLVGRVFPGTIFSEIGREGNPPHLTFSIGASVNDAKHVGVARSKKEAKKNCAIEILKANNIPYNTNV